MLVFFQIFEIILVINRVQVNFPVRPYAKGTHTRCFRGDWNKATNVLYPVSNPDVSGGTTNKCTGVDCTAVL